MVSLSKLEEIKDLRRVWPHEALDFTPWLAQDDNIALLADAIGLDITIDETESSVGDFNVDIFASETGTIFSWISSQARILTDQTTKSWCSKSKGSEVWQTGKGSTG